MPLRVPHYFCLMHFVRWVPKGARCVWVILQVPGGLRGFEKYRYKGGYWEAREGGNWEGVRNIYGPGPKSAYGSEQPAELLL